MKRKRLGILLVVVGLLVAIGTGVYVYQQAEEWNRVARQISTVDVVVAKADLPQRVAIQGGALTVAKMPPDLVPPGAATKPGDVIAKYPLTQIYKGETVILAKLADSAGKTGPSFTLKEGMVAVEYGGTDLLSSVGAIRQGDRVDMLISLPFSRQSSGDQNQGAASIPIVTQTMLQNIAVLRVGNFPTPGQQDSNSGRMITFEVSHQDALVLKWAKDSGGTIDLVLRHPADLEPVETEPITANYIFRKFNFTFADPLK